MRANVRRWYANPAITEVALEIRGVVPEGAAWPEEIYGAVAERFPGFGHFDERLSLDAQVWRYGEMPGSPPPALGQPARICTYNDEQSRAVQVGPGVCVYNVMPPYGHYEDHMPMFRRVIDAYLDADHPSAVGALAQHYVNEFRFARAERPCTFFRFYPPLPDELQKRHAPVLVEVQPLSFDGGLVRVVLKRVDVNADTATYVMHLHAESDREIPASTESVIQWNNRAHTALNRAFDMSVTADCRKLLREL